MGDAELKPDSLRTIAGVAANINSGALDCEEWPEQQLESVRRAQL
jgi:hypothetical protein